MAQKFSMSIDLSNLAEICNNIINKKDSFDTNGNKIQKGYTYNYPFLETTQDNLYEQIIQSINTFNSEKEASESEENIEIKSDTVSQITLKVYSLLSQKYAPVYIRLDDEGNGTISVSFSTKKIW